jgi:hypothetical protein
MMNGNAGLNRRPFSAIRQLLTPELLTPGGGKIAR